MRSLLLLVLLIAPLAGCLTEDGTNPSTEPTPGMDIPEPQFEILDPYVEYVPSSVDGKGMHNVVFRPDTEDPVGVFINFSPYFGITAVDGGDNFATYMIEEYVPRGFAVVLSDLRGTGRSEGCFQIGGDLEVQDLYDVIDHYANEDWSNGRIAAGGKSYDSTPQNGLIAKNPHPNLEGLFHVSGITDMYRYNYRDGVAYTSGRIFNTYYYLQGTDEYGLSFLGTPSEANLAGFGPDGLLRLVDDVACPELPQMQLSGVGSGVTGLKDAYWQERDWIEFLPESDWDGHIFFVHGLQDWNVKPDHIDDWIEALPEQVDYLLWLHQDTAPGPGGHVYPMRDDWNQTMLIWMQEVLGGTQAGLDQIPRVQSQATDGVYRTSEVWPATKETLQVPVTRPTLVEGPARIVGQLTMQVEATTAGVDDVFLATVYDVGNGTETWVTEFMFRTQLTEDLETFQALAPGTSITFSVDSYPVDHILEAGHALELRLGATSRYGSVLPTQTMPTIDEAMVEIHLGDLDATLAKQPLPTPCFAC